MPGNRVHLIADNTKKPRDNRAPTRLMVGNLVAMVAARGRAELDVLRAGPVHRQRMR